MAVVIFLWIHTQVPNWYISWCNFTYILFYMKLNSKNSQLYSLPQHIQTQQCIYMCVLILNSKWLIICKHMVSKTPCLFKFLKLSGNFRIKNERSDYKYEATEHEFRKCCHSMWSIEVFMFKIWECEIEHQL